MKVALDAMGGDYAPASIIQGACKYLNENNDGVSLILVGDEPQVREELKKYSFDESRLTLVHAPETILMHDSPLAALKTKRNSSIAVLAKLMKEKIADAIISNGNTGAHMAASAMIAGKIEGVVRPTIGTYCPGRKKSSFLLDVGASVDCKPLHLLQFGLMGSIFVEHLWQRENPTVALLSVGEEKSKGNETTVEAYKLLQDSPLNFAGNVEGRDLFAGEVDVIVCDGFVGNILLKFAESMPYLFYDRMSKEIESDEFKIAFKKVVQEFDYEEYGGVPLLGVNGVSIVGHGVSSPRAVGNAIRTAGRILQEQVTEHISSEIIKYQGTNGITKTNL